MAFLKKKSKIPAALLRGLLLLLILCVLCGCFYFVYQAKIREITQRHNEQIDELRFQLYQLERQALVPRQDIPFGTILSEEQFEQVNLKLAIDQEMLLDHTDMGKVCLITLPKGMPVTKSSAVSEPLAADLRKTEFNMFLIQTDQVAGDFVDIRIVFPNAENYIVLGKKQIKAMNAADNIIWLWLDETEIHFISSAIIDAYLHPGTKLYATTYIQPETQSAAIPYYPPNPDVLDLMRTDPNILKKASDTLARQARAQLQSHLQALTMDDVTKVSAGVEEEISIAGETVKKADANKTEEQQNNPQSTGTGQPSGQEKLPADQYN